MINKITTLLIIILVNTYAIAQQVEYKLGEQFLDFALQDYKLGKYQSSINNFFTSNQYFSKIGSDEDTIIAINNYLIGQCHKALKSDSSVFYFEKVYQVLGESNYSKDRLIINNFIEKYLAEYYYEINIRNSMYYYKKLLQTSLKLYGATNFPSLWSASVLSKYYNSNNAFNADSFLYYADYLISNDSCYYMSLKTDIFITKIEAHLYFGDKSLVPGIVNEYLMILEKYDRDNQLKKIQAYSLLSLAFQGLNDSKMALKALIQEKVILEKYFSSNDSLLAQCYSELGAIYANLFNHKESKIYFDKAKSSFARINNELNEDYLKYLNNLSGYFQSVSELDSSIYFAKLRLSLLSKTGNKERVFQGLNHIASLYDQNYQYDKSDEIYSNLYSEIKQGSTIDNNIFYKNYLKHLLDIGKIDKAKILFDELKKEIDLNQVTYWQILFLHYGNELMAEYYKTKGERDSALYYYHNAREICKKFKSNYDRSFYCATINTKIGSFYFDLGEYTNAIEIINESINAYSKNLDLHILSSDYLMLSTCYFNNGLIDSALTILEKIGNSRLDNHEIALDYYMQKSQIYNYKYHNLRTTLLYLDSAFTIINKEPQNYILQYVNYLNSYCYLYNQNNQGLMAITKLLEGIETIQKLKGDSSIIVYKIMNNSILETTKLNDSNLSKRVKDAIILKNALMVKYNIKNEAVEIEEMLTKIRMLQPIDAIFCCHNFIDKKKLVSLLGYEKGLVYYNQILSANHAHLNNMDSALYYANLNLDIVRKGLVNTYNTRYIATIGVLKCYYFLGDYANFFEIDRLYKEMNLDTLDLEYLHQTRLAFSSINSESGFDISDLMMQLKENSLNEKLFFIPFNQRAKLLFGFRRDFNNHEAILYRLRDKLNLRVAYNSILRSENILLNTELISRSAEENLSNSVLFQSLIFRKAQLQDSINIISNINLENDFKISQEIGRLKKEQYENQRQIFELIGDTLTNKRKSNINFQALQSCLNDNDIVVHYRYIYSSKNSDSSLYYAFIYDKQSEQPQIVGRFNKGQLDRVLSKESNDDIYSNDALYNLILKPYENLIEGKHTRMIIIPDEELFNVSFNAIRMSNDSFLIEKKGIVVLSSINDLMDRKDNNVFRISSNTNVLIYGGINYQEKDTLVTTSIKKSKEDKEPYFVLNRNSKFKLNYLPGTLEEISSVSKLLAADKVKYQIVKGDDAKEEKFYEYIIDKSPAILHFATHGYFLDDSVKTIESEDININKSLMQNGIFLSNSQKTWDKGIIGYDKSDGIINGLEMASTNLSNTELVVLSACNSGKGKIVNREGVYGLQKGFKLAGAKSILYTLWPIPDKETVDFITKFYKYLLEEENPNLAYRKTVSELLLLDQYRATPSIWAGFVLVN